jgi:hypothetical protein
MTTLLLIALPLLVALIALGWSLWRLSADPKDTEVTVRDLTGTRPACRTYEPLSRLFSAGDSAFLRAQPGYSRAIERRLCRQRRQVLSLYLRQIRAEFTQVWNICRLLAPVSSNPDFGWLLMKQFAIFHGLYWTLQLRSMTGGLMPVHADPADLVAAFRQLELGARRALQTLEPAQVAALGA